MPVRFAQLVICARTPNQAPTPGSLYLMPNGRFQRLDPSSHFWTVVIRRRKNVDLAQSRQVGRGATNLFHFKLLHFRRRDMAFAGKDCIDGVQ
jgi:hypothetical protein